MFDYFVPSLLTRSSRSDPSSLPLTCKLRCERQILSFRVKYTALTLQGQGQHDMNWVTVSPLEKTEEHTLWQPCVCVTTMPKNNKIKNLSFWSNWAVFFVCLFLRPKISCLKENFYITVNPEIIETRVRGSVLKKWSLLLLSGLRKQEKSHFRHLKEFQREGDWQSCTCYLSVEGYQMEQELFCSLEEHKKPLDGFIEAIRSGFFCCTRSPCELSFEKSTTKSQWRVIQLHFYTDQVFGSCCF